ncbi:hypothetical protein ACFVEM_08925 [Streptomyces tendae]|uniref:hypothetical protein n=1 Tax=Streptomyces tendae TaxID=1932 RepID=UPI0036B6F79F
MRADDATVQVDCPGCGKPLAIPLTLSMTGRATASVTFSTAPVQEHLAEHAAAECGDEESP